MLGRPTPPQPGPIDLLDAHEFEIPRSREHAVDDFPAYLRQEFDRYIAYYTTRLKPYFQDGQPYAPGGGNVTLPILGAKSVLESIEHLTTGLLDTVQYYYEGRLLQAMEAFRGALNGVNFRSLVGTTTYQPGFRFYRTRVRGDRSFTRHDLFHNPYENRGRVATSRYSIPGLPALYLGDSTYVCWEEYGRERIENLFFSAFTNEQPVSFIKIQRLNDFAQDLRWFHSLMAREQMRELLTIASYLILFPLYLACSIRTRHRADTFKPEYIIPQLLLQYVTTEKEVAGIMFPSTRVDYSKLHRVPAYNFVFPVKQVQPRGYCRELASMFSLTEPTSTELESLLNFVDERGPKLQGLQQFMADPRTLALTEGTPRPYGTTTFGFLEFAMISRPTCQLIV